MATANSFISPQAINTGYALTTAAKTVLTDTSNLVLLYTASANGSLIKSVKSMVVTGTGSTAYLYTSKDGTPASPATAQYVSTSNTGITFADIGEVLPFRLAPNERLYGAANAAGIQLRAAGEDY